MVAGFVAAIAVLLPAILAFWRLVKADQAFTDVAVRAGLVPPMPPRPAATTSEKLEAVLSARERLAYVQFGALLEQSADPNAERLRARALAWLLATHLALFLAPPVLFMLWLYSQSAGAAPLGYLLVFSLMIGAAVVIIWRTTRSAGHIKQRRYLKWFLWSVFTAAWASAVMVATAFGAVVGLRIFMGIRI